MRLDAYTLLIVVAFVSTLVGVLIVIAWAKNRQFQSFLWWATSFFMVSFGTVLLLLHNQVHEFLSIDLGHALIVLSGGLVLTGARVFNGRTPNLPVTAAGAFFWVFLVLAVGDRFTFADRIVMTGLIAAIYFALSSWEMWRGTGELNFSQSSAAIFLLVHASLLFMRFPFPLIDEQHSYQQAQLTPGFTFMTFEALIYSVGLAFLLLTMTLERDENRLKKLALTDPLTGISNRRAVELAAEKIIRRDLMDAHETALLAFDLDLFKRINDTYGHDTGDRVLQMFAKTAQAALRQRDIFGRIGGEEFIALLPNTNLQEALAIAERIRLRFAKTGQVIEDNEVSATTSVGVATTAIGPATFEDLKERADAALYCAKAEGRNRVRFPDNQINRSPDPDARGSAFRPA